MKKWYELVLYADRKDREAIEYRLISWNYPSYELIDTGARIDKKDLEAWLYFDEKIFENEHSGLTFKLYGDQESDKKNFDEILKKLKEEGLALGIIRQIDESDWQNNWKDFYHLEKIGENFLIKPSWEEVDPDEKRIVIKLDPGMAFGTGNHETTKMSLEFLEKYLKKGQDLIDIGSGSGILSIAAKLLGAGKVLGVDLDETSIEIARENARKNQVDIEFRASNLFSNVQGQADIILANIVAEIIRKILPDLDQHLKRDGLFIMSGIIDDRLEDLVEYLDKFGLEIIDQKKENEWNSLVARYKDV